MGLSVWAGVQTPYASFIQINSAINDNNYILVDSLLAKIEDDCLTSDNDTVKYLYNKFKGLSLFFQHNYEASIPPILKTISLYEKLNLRDIDYLEAYLEAGIASQKIGDNKSAERYYRRGLLKSVIIKEPKNYRSNIYLNLGNLYKEQGDSLLAKECYARIHTKYPFGLIDGSLKSDDLFDSAEVKAIELRKQGKYEEAINIYDNLIQKHKQRFGAYSNDYISLLYSKAIVLGNNLGKKAEAISVCEEGISLKEYLPNNTNVIGCYCKLLQFESYLGHKERVDDILPEALDYIDKCDNSYEERACLYRLTGNGAYWNKHYDMAIPFYEKYLEMDVREQGDSYLEIPNMLAVAYLLSDIPQPKKANSLLKKILKNYASDLNEHPAIKSTILHNYGRSFMLLGDKSRAIKHFKSSNELYVKIMGEDNPKTIQYISECQR